MNLNDLLQHFLGTNAASNPAASQSTAEQGNVISQLTGGLPSGFAGGAATGGIVGLLIGSKSGRKLAGKLATYGGVALLGGMAYKALRNWQQNEVLAADSAAATPTAPISPQAVPPLTDATTVFEVTLIKAMIAAAKADGHIDNDEQRKIFDAVQQMAIPVEVKGMLFDLMREDIAVADLATEVGDLQQGSEVYLASYMVIDAQGAPENQHLKQLAQSLGLPLELTRQLEAQAAQGA